jgi:hypothetical protein
MTLGNKTMVREFSWDFARIAISAAGEQDLEGPVETVLPSMSM